VDRLERATHDPALLNMLASARLVAAGALARTESRGGHWRSDYPATREKAERTFMTLADSRHLAAEPLRDGLMQRSGRPKKMANP
jgi:L-aspartate oxidase